jgi:hypothetical protein
MPPPRLLKILPWAATAFALIALLVVAVRVRDRKIEARRARIGEPITPPGDGTPREFNLPRGAAETYEDFTLSFLDGRLLVRDRKGRAVADFAQLDRGGARGWQELQIEILSALPEGLSIRARIEPGAPCRGPGIYRLLRTGLRIVPGPGSAFTVSAWDPRGGRLQVQPDGGAAFDCPPGEERRLGPWRLKLEPDAGLRVESE